MNDLKFAVRQLLKHRGFTIVAVLTLALGIGVNTSMFSVLNTVLFRALPYPEPERLVRVFRTSPHSQSWPHSVPNFLDYRDQNTVFEHMTAFRNSSYNLAEPGEPAERLDGMRVTADFFRALNVQPAFGRVFTVEEDKPGADRVIILSDRFWLRRFAGDTNVVGRTVRVDGQTTTIIGVMPPAFEHPLLWGNTDLWRPMSFTDEQRQQRGNNSYQSFGRLKRGVSLKRAEAEMKALGARIAKQYPENSPLDSLRLEALQRSIVDEAGRKLSWFSMGIAGFVLLIACANLANLQLVRTIGRAREFAVRAALGAQRSRLLRQSLTESILISLFGGAFGLLLATWSNGIIGPRLFSNLTDVTVTLDLRVFAFALICSLLTGVLFGAVPAWLASRADVNDALKDNLRGTTGSKSHHRLRHALIVGEVGFALIMLAGAGLFIGGLQRFLHQNPGWRLDNLVFAQISLKGTNYTRSFQRRIFFDQLEERLAALPGVERVGLSESLPIWPFGSSGSLEVEGRPVPRGQTVPEVYRESVSPKYFETLGIRLLQGRPFAATDTTNTPNVVIINETMARRFWPNQSAIGKRITSPGGTNFLEIVGVVNDVRFPASLGEPYTRLQSYRPMSQALSTRSSIALRTRTGADRLANIMRKIVAELDPEQSLHQIRSARGRVQRSLGAVSVLAGLLGAFAGLGLVLAGIGIYGVTSYSVVQRTSEIGIRMALGAQPTDVLWLVLSNGLRVSLLGALFGLAGAWAISRFLTAVIPSLPTRDPGILAVITAALMTATLLACYIPARRATKVNPIEALRYE